MNLLPLKTTSSGRNIKRTSKQCAISAQRVKDNVANELKKQKERDQDEETLNQKDLVIW